MIASKCLAISYILLIVFAIGYGLSEPEIIVPLGKTQPVVVGAAPILPIRQAFIRPVVVPVVRPVVPVLPVVRPVVPVVPVVRPVVPVVPIVRPVIRPVVVPVVRPVLVGKRSTKTKRSNRTKRN